MYRYLYSIDSLMATDFRLLVFVFSGNRWKESILSGLKIQNVKIITVGEWDGDCVVFVLSAYLNK